MTTARLNEIIQRSVNKQRQKAGVNMQNSMYLMLKKMFH